MSKQHATRSYLTEKCFDENMMIVNEFRITTISKEGIIFFIRVFGAHDAKKTYFQAKRSHKAIVSSCMYNAVLLLLSLTQSDDACVCDASA